MYKKRVLGAPDTELTSGASMDVPNTPFLSSPQSSSCSSPLADCDILQCPICTESMVTLNQLNRHLDDEHAISSFGSSETNSQIELDFKHWFKRTLATKVDDVVGRSLHQNFPKQLRDAPQNSSLIDSNADDETQKLAFESSSVIPRDHWQKPTGSDTCSYNLCSNRLNGKNGMVNCRKCGRLFCGLHSRFRIKLDSSLHSDPTNGYWSRCCQECFFSYKPGWDLAKSENCAFFADRSSSLKSIRSKKLDSVKLETVALENRCIRLVEVFKDIENNNIPARNLRSIERKIANWVDDAEINSCNICRTEFNFWNRKHHCRICGQVVCGDSFRGCSMDVPANMVVDIMNIDQEIKLEKLQNSYWSIRMCLNCKQKLFNKRLYLKSAYSDTHSDLLQCYRQVKALEAKFENSIHSSDKEVELKNIDLLGRVEKIGKLVSNKISALEYGLEHNQSKPGSISVRPDELKLYKALKLHIVMFLQDNLPELRRAQQEKLKKEQKELAQQTGINKYRPRLLKKEIREYREKLMVLNEQKFMVQNMYNDHKKRKKFDDLISLETNLEDLQREIDIIEEKLGDSAFQ
ncbi:hypothetical protein KL930_005009 [Ogataea haglerorum]|nr:hypothetical protein KL914_005149 [Ogataea haglerorum]KAG7702643.1 hypothetical protein KL950_005188 [Ogataea haglerorum]KAG7733491.1 hypothetical protein KL932_005091 [Ogataea haglerorum]KAG7772735.1 hypothetical protein KL930_005009 [Ogataea haglerorum]KAG7773984.1 hypothetical protein KL922_004975 [Ogataea haglerorum]